MYSAIGTDGPTAIKPTTEALGSIVDSQSSMILDARRPFPIPVQSSF